ncbi:MAG: D-glycero-beta-D-manno-heptose 1-phosphate adenylyltransferase [Bacteroidota bacterium]
MTRIEALSQKLPDVSKAVELVNKWQNEGQKVVFTNGCFDILHLGHLHYLAAAADLGDKLVVGLNSDASVKRLKGESRPINDIDTRTHMLAAIGYVNMVVVFEDDTPLDLIKALSPDILVKGGDWALDQIVGADHVKSRGGEVKTLKFLEGYSTTTIIARIKQD